MVSIVPCAAAGSIEGYALNINFSVDVNMYSEKVTSYWYRLRWNQRSRAAGYNMAARRRADAQARRTMVAKDVESTMKAQLVAITRAGKGSGRCRWIRRLAEARVQGVVQSPCQAHFGERDAQGSCGSGLVPPCAGPMHVTVIPI
jgi:hypothetical protein